MVRTATHNCLERIRSAILDGRLLPGHHINQYDLAEQLNSSRIPIREALAILTAEGVVVHTPNVGYAVARFDLDDLRQIYLMRRVLEAELVMAGGKPSTAILAAMAAELKLIEEAAARADVSGLVLHNREFHFLLFRGAGMPRVVDELSRLWNMSEFYRSLHVFDARSRARVNEEHKGIMRAARRGDVRQLIEKLDAHRSAAEGTLTTVLARLGSVAASPDGWSRAQTVRIKN